jgi:hypothetical protein
MAAQRRLSSLVWLWLTTQAGAWLSDLWTRDVCMDVEIIRLLHSSLVDAVARACAVDAGADEPPACDAGCRRAVEALVAHRCFGDLSRAQVARPRATPDPYAQLQGTWLGLYPPRSLELVRVVLAAPAAEPADGGGGADAGAARLVATKLTGNAFVGPGRTTWEASARSCRVQSSEFAGAFVPRWDGCALEVGDANHFRLQLFVEGGRGQVVPFVRAERTLMLGWEVRGSPTRGVGAAVAACGLDSAESAWLDRLDAGGRAIALDQLLVLAPLALLAAVRARRRRGGGDAGARAGPQPAAWPLQVGCVVYAFLAYRRLSAIGVWGEMRRAVDAVLGAPRVRLHR